MLESPTAEAPERPIHKSALLSVRGLTGVAISSVSFELMAGECLAIFGPSGSGKSLFLRALADLDPNSGDVRLEGRSRESMIAPQWRRLVTYAAAEPGWWASKVGEHFADWSLAEPLAQRLGLPSDCASWPVSRLSTGESQRLGLIRVLIQSPKVYLLDEPTAALDHAGREAVEGVMRDRLAAGAAVLWITHDREQAKRMAARCLRIRDGRAEEADL